METLHHDLTVAGGGIAGMCAAVAAARHGLKTALVTDRPVPGGNASSEVAVSISGAASEGGSRSVYAREGGIVEEIKLRRLFYNQTAPAGPSYQDWPMEDAAYFDLLYGEKNLDLYLNASVRTAEVRNGLIRAVGAVQLGSEKELRFESPLFADCTGDGAVGCLAGARYRWGEEAKGEFHESLAPDAPTRIVMGSTILFFTRDAGRKVRYRRPAFAYDVTKLPYFQNIGSDALARGIHRERNVYCGYWWIEVGGLLDTVGDNEKITLELRRLAYGLWDYIKNSGRYEGADTLILDKVATVAGKRESRRFAGDYVLTQNDVEQKTGFPDAVCVGGWSMDVHAPHGICDPGPASHWHPNNGMYNIPLRCLYSRDIPNLFFAGRDISCTHIALGSTRVMATCGCEGQAVGTAAALCLKYGEPPARIAAGHMKELRELLLRDDQTIVGAKEPADPELLRDLTVAATSVKEAENPRGETFLPLNDDYCLAMPVRERLDSVELHLKNAGPEKTTLRARLYGGTRPENYIPETLLKETAAEVPGGFDGWLRIPAGAVPQGDGKIYMMFGRNEKLSLSCNREKPVGFVTFFVRKNEEPEKYPRAGRFFLHRREACVCFRAIAPAQRLYGPENLVNGYSRPYGLPNLWISRDDGTEQSVTLEYAVPKRIRELQLVFDTRLEYDNFTEPMPELVRDYRVEITGADGAVETIDERDNERRVRRHPVGGRNVRSVRIVLKSTYGAPDRRLYAVRLY